MVIYLMFVLLIPLGAMCLWGALIAFSDSFSYQFGIGLALVGIFLIFSLLGFSNWYGHKWYLDRLTSILFTIAFLAAFSYCFIVLFIPNYFTYNGCTAIFFALNFVFASYLANTKDRHNNVSLSILIENLVSKDLSQLEDDDAKLKEIIDSTKEENAEEIQKKRLLAIISYSISIASYAIIILIENDGDVKFVGVLNLIMIVLTDIM